MFVTFRLAGTLPQPAPELLTSEVPAGAGPYRRGTLGMMGRFRPH